MATRHNVGEIIVSNAQFEWKINILDELKSTAERDKICSPKFTSFTSNDKNLSWYLSLYPKGNIRSSDGYMAAYLNSDNDYDVTLSYTLSLMTNNRELIRTEKYDNQTIKIKNGFGESSFISKFFVLNPINNIMKENKITIVCNINENSSVDEKTNQNNLQSCQKMIENIFECKKYSDITILSANKVKFFLHKCILAQQSSVFEAMFDTDVVEKKGNLVKIDDFDSSVLNEFFEYFYTGKINENKAKDLLIVAEKYNVEKLKVQCEDNMSLNVKVEQAIEYLKLADMNNAKKLRSNIIRYMAFNLEKLQEQPEFQSLTAEQLQEIIECHFNLLKE